jgi:uncharacterized protein (TIGR00255 family)
MISSMTGFGKSTVQKDNLHCEAEVKSVNSRYLEISLKLPKNLFNREYEIREFIRNKVKRGKLIINIQLKKDGIENNIPVLNKDNLKYAVKFLKELKKVSKISDKITLEHLLSFQEIFFSQPAEESEEEIKIIQETLDNALDDLIIMRKKEGEELYKDIAHRLNKIQESVVEIETISKDNIIEHFGKLKERAKIIFEDVVEYNNRLELELALLVDKSDVTEECVRLKSHTKFFLETMNIGNDVGRKLNFLCQEINREANTIGSKSLSTDISHQTVSIKEETERIREQIQNIE